MKYSRFLKRTTDDFFRDFSALGNPLILITLFFLVLKGNALKKSVIGLFTVMAICYLIKAIFYKERPNHLAHKNTLEKIQAGSFPSVHSAEIMYSGLVIIQNTSNPIVDVLFAITILIVGYSRHYLKKHYITDIMGGYAIGLLAYFLWF